MQIDAALIDPENSAADGRPTTLDASGATTHATTLTSASEMDGNPKTRAARTPATREHTNAAAMPAEAPKAEQPVPKAKAKPAADAQQGELF